MLIAEEQTGLSTGNYFTGAMMLLTTFITYLAGRDRLKFSARTQEMEGKIATLVIESGNLKREIAECESERKEDREHMETLTHRCEHAESETAITKGELKGALGQLKGAMDRVNDLSTEVDKLREMFLKKIVGTR